MLTVSLVVSLVVSLADSLADSLAGFARRIRSPILSLFLSLDSAAGFAHWIRGSEFRTGSCRRMLSLLTIHFSLAANFKCILCMLTLNGRSFCV